MSKSRWKVARAALVCVLSVLLAMSTALAVLFDRDFRVSAQDPNFSDIVKSDKLTLSGPDYKTVPSTMDSGLNTYINRVFGLGLGNMQTTYKISSLSQGSDKAKFTSTAGTEYADGEDTAFYISSDMVTNTAGNSLFTSAGTTMSFTKQEDTESGYFVFDFKIGGELLDAGISSDLLFGLLGTTGSDIGLPFSGDISGHFNTAQLFYKVGAISDEEMNDALISSAAIGLKGPTTIYIAGNSLDDYSESESAATFQRAAWITDGNDVATSSVVKEMEDGWYQARIPVEAGSQNISLGLTFGTTNLFSACVDTFFGMAHEDTDPNKAGNVKGSGIDSFFVIRNVDFKESEQGAEDSVTVTVEGAESPESGLITANVGEGAAQTNDGATLTLSQAETPFVGQKLHLKLDESKLGGKTFYGFDVGGVFYGGKEIDAEILSSSTQVKAILGEADTYEARGGAKFYNTFKDALDAANQAGKGVVTVAVPKGRTLTLDGTYTINKGVTVVLPFDEEGNSYGSGVYEGAAARGNLAKDLAWQEAEKYLYNTVEFSGSLTVNGKLIVGGVVNAPDSGAQSRTSGEYAELKNSGNITVNGEMNVYGRVTGNGKITVPNGGKLAEPFLILDYTTGENAADAVLSGILDRINGHTATTPFMRYAMVNVENTMTVEYGGQLYGYLSLYALGRMVSFNQPIVGTESDNCFMMLSSGASVTISYDGTAVVDTEEGNCTEGIGRTTMNFTGGAKIGALSFTVFGVTFDSEGFVFSIPYNYDITLGGSGDYELATEFMVMPGASLTLGEGATLKITHTFWTLEGYQADKVPYLNAEEGKGKSYPTADQLAAAGYSKSGNFIVNGDLSVGTDGEEIAFLGIVQTTGSTGTMDIGNNVDLGESNQYKYYQDYTVSFYDPWPYKKNYPTAAGQFDPGVFINVGKVRQAQDALRTAQPHVKDPNYPDDHTSLDEEAEAAARAIRFFVLMSPARVYDGLGWAQYLVAGNTYTAKRDVEWNLKSYYYFNNLQEPEYNEAELDYQEYEINQIMHGGWMIDHIEDDEPNVREYANMWNRGELYESECLFGENEPCKPIMRYHNALGCEEKPDTKLLINPDFELHVPYTGGTYSMNEDDVENLSLYDIIKSTFFQHIITTYPEKIDWAQYYIYRDEVETDEVFQNYFFDPYGDDYYYDHENPYLKFTVSSGNGGDICEPGEYVLNISFGSTNYYYVADESYGQEEYDEVYCAYFASYGEWDRRVGETEGTIKVVVDPIPLLSAEDDPELWGADGRFQLEDWQIISVMCSKEGEEFDLWEGLPAGTKPEDIAVTSIMVWGRWAYEEFNEPFWDKYPFLQCKWEVDSREDPTIYNYHILEYCAIGQEICYEKKFSDPSECIEWHLSDDEPYLLIKGDGNYFEGIYKFPVEFRKTELKSVKVVGTYVYEGQPVTPQENEVLVYDENENLVQSSEYTFEASNNDRAGRATITVTAKPESALYTGTITGTFYISPPEADVLTVIVELSGPAQKPYGVTATFNIKISGALDVMHYYTKDGAETDVAVSEEDILKGIISVTSDGAVSTADVGKYNINFEIKKDTDFTAPDRSGNVITAEMVEQIVSAYKEIIFEFNRKEVSCNSLGAFSGILAENALEVVPLDLSTVNWDFVPYRGSEKRGYSPVPNKTANLKSFEYDGQEKSVMFTGVASSQTTGIQLHISYGGTVKEVNFVPITKTFTYNYGNSDRINVGTVKFRLELKESNPHYTGYLESSFEITPKEVTVASVTVESSHTYNGQAQTPTLKVTLNDTDGTVLPADQYIVTYEKDGETTVLNAGLYNVTIAPGRNYTFADGSILTTTFTVGQADISGAKVSVKGTYTYNGTAQTLTPEEITVTVEGITGAVTFTIQEDSYQNNTNATSRRRSPLWAAATSRGWPRAPSPSQRRSSPSLPTISREPMAKMRRRPRHSPCPRMRSRAGTKKRFSP